MYISQLETINQSINQSLGLNSNHCAWLRDNPHTDHKLSDYDRHAPPPPRMLKEGKKKRRKKGRKREKGTQTVKSLFRHFYKYKVKKT